MKCIQLHLETLVKVLVLFVTLLAAGYMIFGKDWMMNAEASKTAQRLSEAFIHVAENYEKYDFYNRYGGKNKICKVPLDPSEPCGVDVDLPQELHTLSKDVVPALGDPKYIVYWNTYDNVESGYWSGWMYLDWILVLLPEEKIAGFLGKVTEVTGKVVEVAGKTAIRVAIAPGLKGLVEAIKFTGKVSKDALAKGLEIVFKNEKEESVFLKAIKNIRIGIKKEAEEGVKEATDLEKNAKLWEDLLEDIEKMLEKMGLKKNIRAVIVTKDDSLRGLEILKKVDVIDEHTASFLETQIEDGKLRFCAPAGTIAALTLTELKKLGWFKEKNGIYYYKQQPIEQELAWTMLLTKEKDTIYTWAYNAKKKILQKLPILKLSKDPEKSVVYVITYNDATGDLESVRLGTIKEVEETKELRLKPLKNCIIAGGLAFFTVDFTHQMEAKYEMQKREGEICRDAICLKGTSLYPRPYKKAELKRAMEDAKICGIKILNQNKYGGPELPAHYSNIAPQQLKEFLQKHGISPFVHMFTDIDSHEFYLVSPCYAYAQIWVASCDDPMKKCSDAELCTNWKSSPCWDEATCCRRCIWVALQRGLGMRFQELSDYNYCVPSAEARFMSFIIQQPWPWTGYWGDPCDNFYSLLPLPNNPLLMHCALKKSWEACNAQGVFDPFKCFSLR